MKFFAALLLAAPFVSALKARDDALPALNPSADILVALTQENALAQFPELATIQTRDTNARRLARGLPLLAPHSTRKHHTPTRADHAPRAAASASSISGALLARDSAGNNLGYVAEALNPWGEYGLTNDTSAVATFSASAPADGSAFDFTVNHPALSSFSLLGATGGWVNEGQDLASGSFNYYFLTGLASSTGADSMVQDVPNTFTVVTKNDKSSESTIWTLNMQTNEVVADWTNTDHSQPSVQFAYYEINNAIAIVGDINAFQTRFGGDIPLVHLYFVGVPSS